MKGRDEHTHHAISQFIHAQHCGISSASKCTYFLFDELRRLVVEDGPQAVSVCRGLRVQAEVERDENGRQLIPEVLLILHSEENRAGVCEKGQKAGQNDTLNP